MKTVIIVYLTKALVAFAQGNNLLDLTQLLSFGLPEDAKLNFTQQATKYGHIPEQYEIITEDGYILTLFRLRGRSPSPVFLQHGIFDSSDVWIGRGTNSLGITLANADYDVWLGNSRGNRYSRRHVSLNPNVEAKFWDFSFNEIGQYDLPAFINKILKLTNASTITAIAHSQGTTAFFVLGSTRPDYNTKINVMIALAPVAYLHHCPPPISTFIANEGAVQEILEDFNVHELLGDNTTFGRMMHQICPTPVVGYNICALKLIMPFTGYDIEEMEPTFFRIVGTHYPAGSSAKSIMHYLQIGRRQVFASYDYGEKANRIVYNSSIPPAYDLSKVTFPVALLTSQNDHISTIPDTTLLKEQLPNVVYYLVNPRKLFNHLDAVLGRRMRIYLFPYIFRLLQIYNNF